MPYSCSYVCFSYILLHCGVYLQLRYIICFNLFYIARRFYGYSKFNHKRPLMRYFLYAEVTRVNFYKKTNQVEIQMGRLCYSSIEESGSLEVSRTTISVNSGY